MNRQDRCKFKDTIDVNAPDSPASSSPTSVKRIIALESEIIKLNSVVSELKSVISNSAVQTALAENQIRYAGM